MAICCSGLREETWDRPVCRLYSDATLAATCMSGGSKKSFILNHRVTSAKTEARPSFYSTFYSYLCFTLCSITIPLWTLNFCHFLYTSVQWSTSIGSPCLKAKVHQNISNGAQWKLSRTCLMVLSGASFKPLSNLQWIRARKKINRILPFTRLKVLRGLKTANIPFYLCVNAFWTFHLLRQQTHHCYFFCAFKAKGKTPSALQ